MLIYFRQHFVINYDNCSVTNNPLHCRRIPEDVTIIDETLASS